jgi:hypothetical protein
MATSLTIGIRSYAGFEGFIFGPDSSVEYLKDRLTGFGGKR